MTLSWHPRGLVLALALLVTACAAAAPGNAVARSAPESFSPLVKRVLPAVVNIAVTETVSGGDVLARSAAGTARHAARARIPPPLRQSAGADDGCRLGLHHRSVRPDRDQQPRRRPCRQDRGLADRRHAAAGPGDRHRRTDRRRPDQGQASGPLPSVALGDSRQVEVGDWVLAAGNPFGLGGSVTAGIISARGRDLGSGPFDNFLQLDAPINPGNSGGPIFNMDGQVIAISTAIVSPSGGSVGIGFATPERAADADRQPVARRRPHRARLARRVGGGYRRTA